MLYVCNNVIYTNILSGFILIKYAYIIKIFNFLGGFFKKLGTFFHIHLPLRGSSACLQCGEVSLQHTEVRHLCALGTGICQPVLQRDRRSDAFFCSALCSKDTLIKSEKRANP